MLAAPAAAFALCVPPRPEQLRRRGAALRADVDGDGRRDVVTIRADPRAPASCGFYLDVASGRRHLSVHVPETGERPIARWPYADPYLVAVVRVGRGTQVVVSRWHGAASAFVSLYGIVGGELRPLRFPAPIDRTLGLYGSVGTGVTHVRCRLGGPLTVARVVALDPVGHRWRLERTEYRLASSRFRVAHRASLTYVEAQGTRVARREGLSAPPFAGCVVVRGRDL